MSLQFIADVGYLLGALGFVIGLRKLSSPDTAKTGNRWAAAGMALAILMSFIYPLENAFNNFIWIFGPMLIGAAIGWIVAKRIQMTDMPQLVSLFNGFGGACAVLLGFVELFPLTQGASISIGPLVIVLLTILIGAISFTGSLLAWAKLDGRVNDRKVTFKQHQVLNTLLLGLLLALSVWILVAGSETPAWAVYGLLILALLYGFSFVAPIGGADMPVVISLLNSLTGLSAAAAGLIYDNQIMLVGGILVGASGTILTILMCQAMNRSLWNVIAGGFGGGGSTSSGAGGDVKEITINDAAILLYYSESVVFIPGYGLAVAQAQKAVKELDDMLSDNGVEVKYAIHPVAGRMPGHMNVLLAEADVPYPKLLDLEESNDLMPNTDVVVIVGANDVVNPAAETEPGSPIYGMPVIQAWKAKHTIVLKRSMSKGYAGIENPLFFHDNNKMLFGDAKDSIQKLVSEVKSL